MTRTHPLTIALLGPFGYGNLGDAAIQDAVIAQLRLRLPSARIVGISMQPEDTLKRHGIETYAYDTEAHQLLNSSDQRSRKHRAIADSGGVESGGPITCWSSRLGAAISWRIARVRKWIAELKHAWYAFSSLRHIDVLLVSGGGQLDEFWGGPYRHPFTLFKWTALARLSRTKVAFLSVGAGSVEDALSRRFLRWALRAASYVSFRDTGSYEIARTALGADLPSIVVPDMAFGLPVQALARATARATSGPLTVAVGPLPFYHPRIWPRRNQAIYDAYVRSLADLCSYLLSLDAQIVFVVGEVHQDPVVIADILKLLKERVSQSSSAMIAVPQIDTVSGLIRELAAADLVVSSRFHGLLLALLLHRPVLALPYERKVRQLMMDLELDAFSVDLDAAHIAAMRNAFDNLNANRARVEGDLAVRVPALTEQVLDQFESIANEWIASPAVRRPAFSNRS